VCIVPGGRAGLIRIAAVVGNIYLAYFVPDYTAYNEMLGIFKNFVAVPVPLEEKNHYCIVPDLVRKEVKRGVSVILTSNPRNPTVSSALEFLCFEMEADIDMGVDVGNGG